MDNALKFTHQGLVSVAVSIEEYKQGQEGENEKEVVVSVEDSGSGVDPEIFPRLFTKFSSKSFSGTGLGLYISKSIIELMVVRYGPKIIMIRKNLALPSALPCHWPTT